MPVEVGSRLWNKVFGGVRDEVAKEVEKSAERTAGIVELVSRHGFKAEVIEWIEGEIVRARVTPGPHEDMLYRAGFRDGLECVLDRMKLLQKTGKESYDES